MSFVQIKGWVETVPVVLAASTTVAAGAALTANGSGGFAPSASTDLTVFAISCKAKASTDSDYASTTNTVGVLPHDQAEFLADVQTGTATAAMVGTRCDLNSTTGTGINVNGTSHNQVTIVGFVSATQVIVKFNGAAQFKNAA